MSECKVTRGRRFSAFVTGIKTMQWRVYDFQALFLGLPRFQNLLLIVYDHINTICAIIQRLFRQIKL